jgi:hypothetical protein
MKKVTKEQAIWILMRYFVSTETDFSSNITEYLPLSTTVSDYLFSVYFRSIHFYKYMNSNVFHYVLHNAS